MIQARLAELNQSPLDAVVIGRLTRDYLLPYECPPWLDRLGGGLAYAATGLMLWGGKIGLAARVSSDFPMEWLDRFQREGADLVGVKPVKEPVDERFFVAYGSDQTPRYENPLPFFAEKRLPFPMELLNYDPHAFRNCSRFEYQGYSFHVNDLPRHYLEASAAHICPIDYISHKILPSLLKTGMIQTLTMRASSCYMDLNFWEEIKLLISDLTAFSLTEAQGLKLFQGRSLEAWDIMEQLSAYGPEYILMNMADGSSRLLDRIQKKRWMIPAYPVKVLDPTGALDAFDGGFLLNYRREYDAVEGLLHAVISMGFAQEGTGPYFLLDSFPGLKEARLEALRPRVRAV